MADLGHKFRWCSVISDSDAATLPSGWIVVTTHPHRELFAGEHLVRQDYNVYCPLIAKNVRHARRIYEVRRALFPGYLFIERSPSFILRSILGTFGVRSVVRNGDIPALLPSGFVTSLKAREIDGVIKEQEAPLEPGQAVTIDGGPFDGVVGKILEVRESDRVVLLLDLIHSQPKLIIDKKMLRSG